VELNSAFGNVYRAHSFNLQFNLSVTENVEYDFEFKFWQ